MNLTFWKPVIRTLRLCERGCEHSWLFFEAKWCPPAKRFGKNWSRVQKHNSNQVCILEVRASHAGRSTDYLELDFPRFS